MRRLVAVGCLLTLITAACGDDGADPSAGGTASTTTVIGSVTSTTALPVPTSTSSPPTTSVAPAASPVPADGCVAADTVTKTLVDESRSTPATDDADELPTRTLDVWIDRPVDPGPWPLIIFAHGLTGHPRSHEMHRRHLAEACFVVVAPAFPLTNNDVPNAWFNAGDVAGQIGDVPFLIDEALDDADLAGLIDPDRIGVIGHSLGGLTTAGAAISPGSDPRVSAAVVMSAGFVEARDDVAVLLVHGDQDDLIPIDTSITAWGVLTGRGMFLTLLGGDHIAGIIDGPSDYGPVVRAVTTAFFAHELHNGTAALDELQDLGSLSDVASIEARTSDGPLDDWNDYFAS